MKSVSHQASYTAKLHLFIVDTSHISKSRLDITRFHFCARRPGLVRQFWNWVRRVDTWPKTWLNCWSKEHRHQRKREACQRSWFGRPRKQNFRWKKYEYLSSHEIRLFGILPVVVCRWNESTVDFSSLCSPKIFFLLCIDVRSFRHPCTENSDRTNMWINRNCRSEPI